MKYYPYLRGRQNELIALRELASSNLISEYTIPILEPLSVSSTFLSTLKEFEKKNLKIAIIMNPEYGDFFESDEKKNIREEIQNLVDNSSFVIKAFIMKKDLILNKENLNNLLIINKNHDSAQYYFETFGDNHYPSITLIPDDRMFKRRLKDNTKVLLEDCFNKQPRNADYENEIDEFFSDALQIKDEGFKGFSDYSIVGKDYVEGGFAPTAVAIHIVYNKEKELRVHHFVSDNKFEIGNVAGKYGESVKKLYEWCTNNNVIKTCGLNHFYESYKNRKFPSLGVAKRWSIMHHIELIDKLLRDDI